MVYMLMKNDRIILEIKNYIVRNRLIEKGDCILVGLSGGPDSVFLLEVLKDLQKPLDFRLFAVHVHHGIRGEEADRDMRFSQELCRERDIPFKVVCVDAPKYAKEKGMSLEEAARILRYEVFETERKILEESFGGEARSCRIAVAHHMDDQAETVLHNLVRGSGIKGLSGMEARRGCIIRPLLSIKREYILRKLEDDGIPYVLDSTNLDTRYTRNRIRTSILPELKEINPEAASHIAKTSDILREADDFFRKLALDYVDRFLETTEDPGEALREIIIPVGELKTYPGLVRQYVMMELVRRIGTPLKDWSTVHFRDMDKLIHGRGNAHLDLPCRMSADYRKKRLILRVNQEILSIKRRKNNG